MLIAITLGVLWLFRVRGAILQLAGAALLFGGAGYAALGRPGLPSSPRSAEEREAAVPLTNLRHAFFGRFGPTEHWLLISESLARRGKTQEAAGVLQSAVREHPGDPILWIGLGNALADHSRMLTPASDLAFRRAIELAPDHPAPRFFYGLALARSGNGNEALVLWRQILAEAPADASWRPVVEDAIAAISGPRQQAQAGS
ncbi:MAG TPA: tetratricopeptide repeat protein [Sphingomicrobium sp.]|nr:tetratricopeptide repeat protein [Sphingomicrobium sp.]